MTNALGPNTRGSVDKDIADLKVVIRKAHETMQEMRALLREIEAKKQEVITVINSNTTSMVEYAVERNLKILGEETGKAINEAQAKIDKRFDALADILLGEDKRTKRQGKPSLTELAQARDVLHRMENS